MKRSRLFHAIVVAGSAIPGEAPPVIALPVVAAAVSTSGCWGHVEVRDDFDMTLATQNDMAQPWGSVDANGPVFDLAPASDLAAIDGAASDQTTGATAGAVLDLSSADSSATPSSDLETDGRSK